MTWKSKGGNLHNFAVQMRLPFEQLQVFIHITLSTLNLPWGDFKRSVKLQTETFDLRRSAQPLPLGFGIFTHWLDREDHRLNQLYGIES